MKLEMDENRPAPAGTNLMLVRPAVNQPRHRPTTRWQSRWQRMSQSCFFLTWKPNPPFGSRTAEFFTQANYQ